MKIYEISFTVILFMCSLQLVYPQKRSNVPIQQDHRTQKDQGFRPPRLREGSKKLTVCSTCHDMYQLSHKEYIESQNTDRYCVRLMQIKKCIKKLKKENSDCVGISLMVLNTGVKIKYRSNKCAARKINTNNIEDILKKNRDKKLKDSHEKCKFAPANKNASETRHCGMFGDPHLRTFYDVRQTCVVAGAWSLLDNDYLAVQVTNQIVQTTEATSATATKKISVIFKETDSSCISQKIYEATSHHLPHIFKDGTTLSGPNGCQTKIRKIDADKVIISSCHINTTIIVRKIGQYLTFNIKTPLEIANRSRGLCHVGCPLSEIVDSTSFFENRINDVSTSISLPTRKEAMTICNKKNLTDFYYDSCVFDLLTTGEEIFSDAARTAMTDALNLDPKLRLRRSNSVVLNTMPSSPSSVKKSISSSARTLDVKRLHVIVPLLCVLSFVWLS